LLFQFQCKNIGYQGYLHKNTLLFLGLAYPMKEYKKVYPQYVYKMPIIGEQFDWQVVFYVVFSGKRP
jgi:hypothetical protein